MTFSNYHIVGNLKILCHCKISSLFAPLQIKTQTSFYLLVLRHKHMKSLPQAYQQKRQLYHKERTLSSSCSFLFVFGSLSGVEPRSHQSLRFFMSQYLLWVNGNRYTFDGEIPSLVLVTQYSEHLSLETFFQEIL